MLWRSLKIDDTLLKKAIFDLFYSTLCELVGPFDPSVQNCLHCDKASFIWLIYLIWKSQSANYSGFVQNDYLFTINIFSKCFWSCALLPFLNQCLSEYLILFSKSYLDFRFCHENTDLQILELKLCKRKLAPGKSNPVQCYCYLAKPIHVRFG